LDDEYFRVCVAAGAQSEQRWKDLWEKRVVGSTFRRSPKLAMAIWGRTQEVGRIVEAKLPLHGREYLILDAKRISRVLCRIVRGLNWHHYRVIPTREIAYGVIPGINAGDIPEILSRLNLESVGDGAFVYHHAVAEEDPEQSLWVLRFSSEVTFCVHLRRRLSGPRIYHPTMLNLDRSIPNRRRNP
jgi:hypothetical protein